MTREQRKRRKRLEAIAWVLGLLALASVLCVSANAAYELEAMTTGQKVTGAFVWAWIAIRVVLWLDTPRKEKR